MNEQAPTLTPEQVQRIETLASDRVLLDAALNDTTSTNVSRMSATTMENRFGMHILVDTRSGRVRKASPYESLEPGEHQALVALTGRHIRHMDADKNTTQETLILGDIDMTTFDPAMTDMAKDYIRDLLSSWKESHNIYIAS